jgi:manganese transport protein
MKPLTMNTESAARAAFSGRRTGLRAFLPFIGPAVMASVAYMDPGNFATNIQAGSTYGDQLLWVVILSSIMAMLFQSMSAKLGIVTGRNLAELCREHFNQRLVLAMWISAEVAAVATDVAEFLGGALGISLLFRVSLLCGLCVTTVATFAMLQLQRSVSYLWELIAAPPDWHEALHDTIVPRLGSGAVLFAVGIVGATIMPHTLYVHSGLTQDRTPVRNDHERRSLLRFSNREVVIALGFAGLINLAMVIMSSTVFGRVAPGVADIGAAYRAVIETLGVAAATVFMIALIASGISSSVIGTVAGQVIMKGFLAVTIPLWARRLITMLPAFAFALCGRPTTVMILSQVVLSFCLPLPLIALVVLSSRSAVMGKFVSGRGVILVASGATAVIVLLNLVLIRMLLF